jgi:thioredoxin 1
MTLDTNLKHLETTAQIEELINKNGNVMICCGRMGPMCIPVYEVMENLEETYSNVQFRDMLFDTPDAAYIKSLPQCQGFRGLPFTVYFKNGEVVEATSSIQTKAQVTDILDKHFQ